jgi:hypothetical protein
MGMGLPDLWLLARLKECGHLDDRMAVAEIGAQQVGQSLIDARSDLENFGRLFGVTTPPPDFPVGPARPGEPLAGYPPARLLWDWVGSSYTAIDVDGSPGSVALDLNFDAVPQTLRGRFALVTNYGSTEHIANQLNAFKAIHDLAAPGAVMVHHVPTALPNHGLFAYTQRFFWQLGRANEYGELFMRQGDGGICVALLKRFALDFVPPLDVPEDTAASNPVLVRRYWTIFDKAELVRVIASTRASSDETALLELRRMVARRWPVVGRIKRRLLGRAPARVS